MASAEAMARQATGDGSGRGRGDGSGRQGAFVVVLDGYTREGDCCSGMGMGCRGEARRGRCGVDLIQFACGGRAARAIRLGPGSPADGDAPVRVSSARLKWQVFPLDWPHQARRAKIAQPHLCDANMHSRIRICDAGAADASDDSRIWISPDRTVVPPAERRRP